MGPSSSYLSNAAILHFHDYGRKSKGCALISLCKDPCFLSMPFVFTVFWQHGRAQNQIRLPLLQG